MQQVTDILFFVFSQVGKKDILEEMQRLDVKKWLKNEIFPPELSKKTKAYLVTVCYLVLKVQ